MLPLPPGRFSTMTCWPQSWLSLSAIRRPRMSIAPAGENAITMRTGRLGKSCADAWVPRPSTNPAAISNALNDFDAMCGSRVLLERAFAAEILPFGDIVLEEFRQ